MSFHVYKGSGAPTSAPTNLGDHYIDETNKKSYMAVGVASSLDWKLAESLDPSTISHNLLQDKGNNTHAQIDSHIINQANPHGTTKAQIGLANVQNLDQANPSNIIQDITHRFVTDVEKAAWNAKENSINPGTTSQFYRGDKTWQQLVSSYISDFSTAVNSIINGLKGNANGLASLGADSKIPSIQLPSFVDDVLEYANLASFPVSGETGKMYIALDSNKTYRWSGSVYVEISASPGSTDAVPEGATNLYFTNSRAIAAAKTNLTNTPPPLTNITDAAHQGFSQEFARQDHKHAFYTTGVIPGNYGNASQVPQFTVNAQGQIISASNITITQNIFGQGFEEFLDDTPMSTNASYSSPVNAASFTTQSKLAGKYRIGIKWNFTGSSTSTSQRFWLFIDGVQQDNYLEIELKDATDDIVYTTFAYVNFLTQSTHTIELKVATESGNICTVNLVRAEIWRVA